ncbi:uncharacterized protein B0P05DRAFT_556524 [Gilbertella persicaria]|uniref:uncharacterized protein n=1 Tax=Gilbertella persicaria TaxID=101096 RepID=UPI002220D825|nr:uncharacterized protein B0P05DRAFT_556524 [Gilbertella persicaria]KAI8062317.1 hypothetical protein B0P05DRAFT_556524 [Gilbertella persicaria]
MSNWQTASANQWNGVHSEYSDEDEYSDDSEYAPIEATSWGNQTISADGTTNVNLTVSGWESLIDPNIKVKEGGIGSGQLHRKGRNFQPIDEQYIIDRRLGKPVPSTSGKKKKGGKKGPKPPSSAPPTPKRRPPPSSSLKPPSSSAYRGREAIVSGPWASTELTSTPFWESPSSDANGTGASKYAPTSASTPVTPTRSQPSQWSQPQQKTQAPPPPSQQQQQQQSQSQSQRQHPTPQQSQWQPPAQQQPPAPAVPPQNRSGFTKTSSGSAASKYASSSAVASVAPPSQSQWNQPQQQPQQQPEKHTQQPPLIHHRLDTPCVNFNIELTQGIHANLAVYANDDPMEVVQRFEKEHHLVMSEGAKQNFCRTVTSYLAHYRSQPV